MACPFGVIRYHQDRAASPGKTIAVKCDNCVERQAEGLIPACVEVCKSNALTFEEADAAMKRRTDEVAHRFSAGLEEHEPVESPTFALLNTFKRAEQELETHNLPTGRPRR
jgi:carbon-monoxide dehydrogenase iron sulfur subunit